MPDLSESEGWQKLAAGVEFALKVHAGQVRKEAHAAYASHLFGVASLVLKHGGDEEQAIAAMLHHAIKDLGFRLEPLVRQRFGARVANIVVGCSGSDPLPRPPCRKRHGAYIAHLERSRPDVLLVSLAEKVHDARNICTDLRTCDSAVLDRFKGAREGTVWYYQTLAEAFERLLPGPLTSELWLAVKGLASK